MDLIFRKLGPENLGKNSEQLMSFLQSPENLGKKLCSNFLNSGLRLVFQWTSKYKEKTLDPDSQIVSSCIRGICRMMKLDLGRTRDHRHREPP